MSKTSTLLTCLGAVGVVITAVLTAKATPKAEKLLLKAEMDSDGELSTWEKVKVAGPAYIPAIVVGSSTIACVFGANFLNKKAQASLASAYALLESSYREYKKKVDELYGDGASEKVEAEMSKDTIEEFDEIIEEDGELLFWDDTTMEHFRSPITKAVSDDGLECYIIATPLALHEKLWAKGYCW
jgi:hypothetical protein